MWKHINLNPIIVGFVVGELFVEVASLAKFFLDLAVIFRVASVELEESLHLLF